MNNGENKPGLFEVMEIHEQRYLNELSDLVENYDKLTTQEGLAKSKKVFDSIRKHFEHQDMLVNRERAKLSGVKNLVDEYERIKVSIMGSMDQLILMHVDEPDFLERLGILLNQVKRLSVLEEARLYRKLKRFMSQAEMQKAKEEVLADFVQA